MMTPTLIDELLQQLRRRNVHRPANLDEFRHIQPPLAALVFGDERLRSPQPPGQLDLRQPGLIARFAHQAKKLPVQRRRQGFHGGDALSFDPEMVYPELEYPKLGLFGITTAPHMHHWMRGKSRPEKTQHGSDNL